MDAINFGYSMKKIPIPGIKKYLTSFIEMTESVVEHMRWSEFLFLYPNGNSGDTNTHRFTTRKSPPIITELREFEEEIRSLIASIRFQYLQPDQVQQRFTSNDVNNIKKSMQIIVSDDKTFSFYEAIPQDYQATLHKCITKDYRKTNQLSFDNINNEDKKIASSLNLDDRVQAMASRESFKTIEDHKKNFTNCPQYRLINQTKYEMARIGKQILEGINAKLNTFTPINQQKNTHGVLSWSNSINDMQNLTFIKFDIVNFYSSITQELQLEALNFATI